jgi:hypothetical protein
MAIRHESLLRIATAAAAALLAVPALAAPDISRDGANAKPVRIDMRNMRFIEIFLARRDPTTGEILAECYGTYANPGIPVDRDSAPQALVQGLDMKTIQKQYGVLSASLNGPKLSTASWWEIDAGTVRQFGGLKAPHTAQLNLGKAANINAVKPYVTKTIARKSAINWAKGTTVMVLDDPSGNTWIMKGYELGLKPQRTYEQFMATGPSVFKKLPPGWRARIVKLQQDNLEVPAGGVASILSDEFFNVYDRTGPGMSSSKP